MLCWCSTTELHQPRDYLHRCNEFVQTPRVMLGWKQIALPAPFHGHEDPSLVLYAGNTQVLLWQGILGLQLIHAGRRDRI